jgi:hypothetical protein
MVWDADTFVSLRPGSSERVADPARSSFASTDGTPNASHGILPVTRETSSSVLVAKPVAERGMGDDVTVERTIPITVGLLAGMLRGSIGLLTLVILALGAAGLSR